MTTTTTASLGHKATVNSVPYELDGDVRINIKKRRVNVFHQTLSSNNRVNITHLITRGTNPLDNLFISDRSRSLTQNTILNANTDYSKISTSTFTVLSKRFLVTNTYTTATATQVALPLFYYHTLKYFNSDLDDWSDRTLLSLEFTDYTMNKREVSEYSTNEATGRVYNNIETSYNSSSLEFDVTYVRYSVSVVSGSTTTIYNYNELINNTPAFTTADISDLDEWGNLIQTSGAYLIDELPDLSGYRITLPISTTDYAYKEIDPSRIQIKAPTAITVNEPWYVRISNGEFTSSVKSGNNSYTGCRYKISEFEDQSFDPYSPYKFIHQEQSVWLYSSLIKTSRNIVDDTDNSLFVDVFVYSVSDVLTYKYTTDTSKVGITEDSITWTAGIASIDESGGFIELVDPITSDNKVLVNYYTNADDFEFVNIDFNPVSNRSILNKRMVFYISPETNKTGELSSTLFYLEVDKLGRIVYSSQADEGGVDYSTLKMLSEDFSTDGKPSHTFYYDKRSTASGLRYRSSGIFSSYEEDFSFVDKYSVETQLALQNIPSGENLANLQENPHFLILGDVYIGEVYHPSIGTDFDMRVLGGGLKPDSRSLAIRQQQEATWFWDDEKPYPGNLSFYAEVPDSIMEEYGGDFSVWQVQDIISKHAQGGSYPVVRSYGLVDPVVVSGQTESLILSGVVISGMATIQWPKYGPDATYDIYVADHMEAVFAKHNSTPLEDQHPYNTYTVDGLTSNVTYYIYVAGNKNGEVSKGPIVSLNVASYL
jgi:hypothetical protein